MATHRRVAALGKYQAGFSLSLLEAIVASLVVAFALISFATMQPRTLLKTRAVYMEQQVVSMTSDIISALNLARSEAIRRRENVEVAPLKGSWSKGWGVTAENGHLLRRWAATQEESLKISGQTAIYNARGRLLSASPIVIDIVLEEYRQCIKVNLNGSASVAARAEACDE